MKLRPLILVFAVLSTSLAIARESDESSRLRYGSDVRPLFNQFCARCHGSDKQEAGLRLDHLNPDLVDGNDGEHWEEVLNQLNIGAMPPEDEPQPTDAQRSQLTDWVTAELKHATEVRRSTGGRNMLRRLTRYPQWSTYSRFLTEQHAYFLNRLKSVNEGEGSLLDNTMVMYGCCTSQTHVSRNYPLVLAGGGNLGLKHGRYLKFDENNVPLSNLFVTMLDRLKNAQEGDGSVLDRTIIMYGCGTSTTHLAKNYPLILAGGSKLGVRHGQFRKFNENKVRLSDMFVSIMNALGVPTRNFGDSTGELNEIFRV